LREADYQTRWLLRTALAAVRPRDIEIDVVNPSSEDRNRLSGFFVCLGRVVKYESIDNFLVGRAATQERVADTGAPLFDVRLVGWIV
jgi:hypothetical protein